MLNSIGCPIAWLATGGMVVVELAFLTMKFKSSTTMNWCRGPDSYFRRAIRIIVTNVATHFTEGFITTLFTLLASFIFSATAAATIGLVSGFLASLAVAHYLGEYMDP